MSKNKKLPVNPEDQEDSFKLLWGLIIIIIFLWIVNIVVLYNHKHRGTFGDMFGGVNALFSGLALAGIIFTIFLQKKELSLQRKELRDTREEFKTQNETLKQQRFENTLFQLINLHHEIVDKLRLQIISNVYGGRNVLPQAVQRLISVDLHSAYNDYIGGKELYVKIKVKDFQHEVKLMHEGYNKFYFEDTKQVLSHFYRNVYHIFKFIHTSNLIEENKKSFYASIVRAQLSSDELLLIYYNSMTPNLGYPKFLFFVKKFDIMQNFDTQLLYKPEHEEIFNYMVNKLPKSFDELKDMV